MGSPSATCQEDLWPGTPERRPSQAFRLRAQATEIEGTKKASTLGRGAGGAVPGVGGRPLANEGRTQGNRGEDWGEQILQLMGDGDKLYILVLKISRSMFGPIGNI